MWLEIPSWSCPHAPADLQAQPANMHADACLAAPCLQAVHAAADGAHEAGPQGRVEANGGGAGKRGVERLGGSSRRAAQALCGLNDGVVEGGSAGSVSCGLPLLARSIVFMPSQPSTQSQRPPAACCFMLLHLLLPLPQRACPLEPAFVWTASASLAPLVSIKGAPAAGWDAAALYCGNCKALLQSRGGVGWGGSCSLMPFCHYSRYN